MNIKRTVLGLMMLGFLSMGFPAVDSADTNVCFTMSFLSADGSVITQEPVCYECGVVETGAEPWGQIKTMYR